MHKGLPEQLYTADQVRKLDDIAIHTFNIPGFTLMERAAQACFEAICQHWPALKSMEVFCGAGNNAGDGYLIATLAKQKGIEVSVITLKAPEQLTGDAQKAWQICLDAGIHITPFSQKTDIRSELVVDAMLGTGLSGAVREDYEKAIELINTSEAPCCAVDIPSGLCANTGNPLGLSVMADLTVSFIGLKQGLLTGQGPAYCGRLHFSDLEVPAEVYDQVPPASRRIRRSQLQKHVHSRSPIAHKGDHGHVLLLGGNYGMPGAVMMAAEAAIHSGAGKVTVATRPEHLPALAIRCPEIMAHGIQDKEALKALLKDKTVVVAGPGLGQDDWAHSLLREAMASECSLVLDADALNLLSQHPQLRRKRKLPIILTPHPGEAARLLQTHSNHIQQDRFAAVVDCVAQFGTITLLKGAGTLVSNGTDTWLCSAGNPGMAFQWSNCDCQVGYIMTKSYIKLTVHRNQEFCISDIRF